MSQKLTLILLSSLIFTIHAQQLSPVQLQKVKADFDKALKDKKFDEAQTHLKQIEHGGRRAYAQELMAELAKAQQQDAEAKSRAELHKAQKAHAQEIINQRELEKRNQAQIQELKKQQENKKEQELKEQLKAAQEAEAKLKQELHEAEHTQLQQAREIRELKQKQLKGK